MSSLELETSVQNYKSQVTKSNQYLIHMNRKAKLSVWKILSCKFLHDFNLNIALTFGPSFLNSADILGKIESDIVALTTWSGASSTSCGILHSSVRSRYQ